MNRSDTFGIVDRVARLTVVLALFVGFCGVVNLVAFDKMELRDNFAFVNARTEHNMRLIDFVNSNRYLVASYFLLFWAALAFCTVRRHPRWSRWSRWSTSIAFSAPCFIYLGACAYISGKILILR
jgi:hypothetical protein